MADPYGLGGQSAEDYLDEAGQGPAPVQPPRRPETPNQPPWYVRYPMAAGTGAAGGALTAAPMLAFGPLGVGGAAAMTGAGALSGVAGQAARDLFGEDSWAAPAVEIGTGLALGGGTAAVNTARALAPYVPRVGPWLAGGLMGAGGLHLYSGSGQPSGSGLASSIATSAAIAAGVPVGAAALGVARLALSPFTRDTGAWRYPLASAGAAAANQLAGWAERQTGEAYTPPPPVAEVPIPPRPGGISVRFPRVELAPGQ